MSQVTDPVLLDSTGQNIVTGISAVVSAIQSRGMPSPSASNPQMDGTVSPGTSNDYARGDHVHPENPANAKTEQIAYVETGTTATKTGGYTAGEYICWQGTLYTANTNIAYGTTLSAATNGNLTECVGGGFNDRSTGTVGRGTMTSGTILSASLVRWGRVVVCTCQLYGLSGINRADCVPFRMPEGFRPSSDTNIQLVFNDGNNGKQWITYGTLKSDGYVSGNNAVLGSFAPNVTAIQIQSAVWLI